MLISSEYCRCDEQLSTESSAESKVALGCCVLLSFHSPGGRYSGGVDDSEIYSRNGASACEREFVDPVARGREESERDWDGDAVP